MDLLDLLSRNRDIVYGNQKLFNKLGSLALKNPHRPQKLVKQFRAMLRRAR